MSLHNEMAARYDSGDVPWDDPLPPPEVIDLVSSLPPGRALDLGCGYGRAAIYLAQRGWQVDAVDFVERAIDVARARAGQAGVEVRFHVADVTDLGFLSGPYDLALDVGCGHGLPPNRLPAYRDELRRLLGPEARLMMFVRLREGEAEPDEGPPGLDEDYLRGLFADGFALERLTYGRTEVTDAPAWPSAWFLFRRRH
ncbi:MAG: class I SAM-dependent methyltransferase [Anaerolineae bacterium]